MCNTIVLMEEKGLCVRTYICNICVHICIGGKNKMRHNHCSSSLKAPDYFLLTGEMYILKKGRYLE